MIAKGSHAIAIKSLRQEESLRDHGGTGDDGYTLNTEI
jgi:hypothetical protein